MDNLSSFAGLAGVFVLSSLAPLLKKCLSGMPRKYSDAVKHFENIINPKNNFRELRILSETANKDTSIPCVALCISDLLIMSEFGDSDTPDLAKFQAMAKTLFDFLRFQSRTPFLTEIAPVLSYFKALPYLPEHLLLSPERLAREPI
eukprot:TRINITY_DN9626_c0_g1_i1.p1 TRINITY_DN9626_c0_g1~~TRINITY_DN9626_c0_g1_i1.p1  ORF type:complete len:147 (-),score=9.94 TRINITY_DN9626_c0_g1_i1:41-481(-)